MLDRTAVRWPSLSILILVITLTLGLWGCRSRPPTDGPGEPAPPPAATLPPPPSPPPAAPLPAGTPERPAVVKAELRIGETYPTGGQSLGDLPCLGGGEYVAGVTQFIFHARLDPVPPAAWYRQNVRVEGDGPFSLREDLFAYGMVEVTFAAGKAGDRVTVALGSVILPGSEEDTLTVHVNRVEECRATLAVAEDGSWREVVPGEILAPRPLKLRIRFTREMRRETVEPYLLLNVGADSSRHAEGVHGPAPGSVVWLDDRTLLWELEDPPPVLRPSVQMARDVDGLWVLGGLPVVYTGEPPRLYLRDPASGQEHPVGPVPADIHRATISPDGSHLLAWGYQVTTAREGSRWVTGVVDPATGKWRWVDAGWDWTYLGWVNGETVLRVKAGRFQLVDCEGAVRGEGSLPGTERPRFAALSPGADRLVFLVPAWNYTAAAAEDYRYPMDLAVVDLGTGEATWTRDFVRHHLPPTCGWRSLTLPAWSPDGRLLAAVTDLAGGTGIRLLDTDTGAVRTATVLTGTGYGSAHRFAWSPTGQHWLLGHRLVGVAPPHPVTPGPWHDHEPEFWSPDGRWLAGGDWEWARLFGVGTGSVELLGTVLPCGFDAGGLLHLIRWPDAGHRYIYQGP